MFRVVALGYRAGMMVDRLRAKKNYDDIRFVYCNTDSSQLHDRVKALESRLPLVMDCQDFDDDYELEGTLRYCFNSEDSVLKLEDDCEYGSDFTLMIKLIADLGYGTVKENIKCIHCSSTPLDDGQSWNEYPFSGRREFADIIIYHAVHQLTGHQFYSIPSPTLSALTTSGQKPN